MHWARLDKSGSPLLAVGCKWFLSPRRPPGVTPPSVSVPRQQKDRHLQASSDPVSSRNPFSFALILPQNSPFLNPLLGGSHWALRSLGLCCTVRCYRSNLHPDNLLHFCPAGRDQSCWWGNPSWFSNCLRSPPPGCCWS